MPRKHLALGSPSGPHDWALLLFSPVFAEDSPSHPGVPSPGRVEQTGAQPWQGLSAMKVPAW